MVQAIPLLCVDLCHKRCGLSECVVVAIFPVCLSSESAIVDLYPEDAPTCPKFICLQKILYQMYNNRAHVHPLTKQVLSSLDQ